MLTHPQAHAQILDFCKPGFLGQIKMDGVRLALVFGDDCQPEYALTKAEMMVRAPRLNLPAMAPGTVLDGELLGKGSWQSAQSGLRELFLGNRVACSWVAFDIIVDPLGVTEEPGFVHRVRFLERRGIPVLPTGEVEGMWGKVTEFGGEGVVVRRWDSEPDGPSWKVKTPQQMNVMVMQGKGMVVRRNGQPHVVCSLPQPDGMYRVSCEGRTTSDKLRAARVIGPALGTDISFDQLLRIRS